MRKTKRYLKKKSFNKTFKVGGGLNQQTNTEEPTTNTEQTTNKEVGTVGLVGNALKDGFEKVTGVVKDAALNAAGLQEKNPSDENDNTSPEVVGKFTQLANRTGATVIEKFNNVIGSDLVKDNIQKAAQKTANIIKNNLEIFNDTLNEPEVKEQVVQAIDNASVIGDALVDASKEPLNKFAENVADEVPNIVSAVSSGLVKAGTDFAGAIPGVGAVIDVLKAANDGATALNKSVEATTNIIESGADLINETKESFDRSMEELEKNKELVNKISNRTTQSINEFTNPLNKINKLNKTNNQTTQTAGRRKTGRRLTKHKSKTKRVRFAF